MRPHRQRLLVEHPPDFREFIGRQQILHDPEAVTIEPFPPGVRDSACKPATARGGKGMGQPDAGGMQPARVQPARTENGIVDKTLGAGRQRRHP